jgi:hypothetical protein
MGKLRTGLWVVAFRLLAATMAFNILAGCSGGYMLSRTFAKWLNAKGIVLRVLLWLFVWPVYLLAVITDEVVLNTIDFWTGRVTSDNTKFFEKDGVRVQVVHSRNPLRRSVFTIDTKNGDHSVIELRETVIGSIEVYRDGLKRNEVKDIESALPTFVGYQADGRSVAWTRSLDVDSLRDLENIPAEEGYAKAIAKLNLPGNGMGEQLACRK